MISISSDCEHISKLKSELTKIQRKRSGNTSMIQIESKADMRSRGMRSPNIADSLVYCFADEGIEEIFTMPVHFASEW
jgi:phage terminase large subunit